MENSLILQATCVQNNQTSGQVCKEQWQGVLICLQLQWNHVRFVSVCLPWRHSWSSHHHVCGLHQTDAVLLIARRSVLKIACWCKGDNPGGDVNSQAVVWYWQIKYEGGKCVKKRRERQHSILPRGSAGGMLMFWLFGKWHLFFLFCFYVFLKKNYEVVVCVCSVFWGRH